MTSCGNALWNDDIPDDSQHGQEVMMDIARTENGSVQDITDGTTAAIQEPYLWSWMPCYLKN